MKRYPRVLATCMLAMLVATGCSDRGINGKPLPIEATQGNGETPYPGKLDQQLSEEQLANLRERTRLQR